MQVDDSGGGTACGFVGTWRILPGDYYTGSLEQAGVASRLCLIIGSEGLLADDPMDLSEHGLESTLHVGGFKSGGLHEEETLTLGELLGVLGGDCAKASQVGLVSDEHYYDVPVGMATQFLQPPRHMIERLAFSDVVHQHCAHCTSVVCTCYRSVPVADHHPTFLALEPRRV